MSVPAFATFWSGPLNALVYSCLASFPWRGASLTLFSYERAPEVPPGVEVRDARDICADPDLLRRYLVKGRPSLATFSDRFRYEMLARSDFCWVDADIVCLDRSRIGDASIIWGRQPEAHGKALINNAVLRLPRDHPVLTAMLGQARAAEGAEIEWGAIGPFLLTEVAESHGVDATAEDPQRFYPIAPDEFWRLLDPSSRAEVDAATAGAAFVHLWSELLRRVGYDFDSAPPPGAFLSGRFAEIGTLTRFRRVCDVAEIQALIERWRAFAPAE